MVNLLHLRQFRAPTAVGTDDAVVDEVALVWRLRPVVACAEFVETVGFIVARLDVVGRIDGLVHPVPNATADAVAARFDDVPIFLEIAHCVAHRVGIFTHEIRLLRPVVVGRVGGLLERGIHLAPDVGGVALSGIGAAFIVDGAWVEVARGLVGGHEVRTVVALVAQTPERDRGVVAIAKHHAFRAVDILRLPRVLESDAAPAAVCPVVVAFHVGLVHHVETIVVKHGVHFCLSRIVARSDGVDVRLLHHLDVAQHGRNVDGASVNGMRVLRVYAFEEHPLSVDVDLAVFDFDGAETIFGGKSLLFVAVGVQLGKFNGVEVRRFSRPRHEVREVVKRQFGGLLHLLVVGRESKVGRFLAHEFTRRAVEAHAHLLFSRLLCFVAHGELHRHRARLVFPNGREAARDVVVAQISLRRGHEIDVAEDAAHVEDVLSFEIRAIGPANHLHAEVVHPFAHVFRHVKFGIVVRAFRVSHLLAVHPNVGTAIDAVEVEENAFPLPACRQGEVAAVRADRVVEPVFHPDVGRVVLEGIFHVDVERVAISLHLQAGRHRDGIPLRGIHLVAVEILFAWAVFHALHPFQFPDTVEAHHALAHGVEPRFGIAFGIGAERFGRFVGHVSGMS